MQRLLTAFFVTLALAGCGDTQQAIDEMNHKTVEARANAAKDLAMRLKAQAGILDQGDIQIFLSSKLLGDAENLLAGFAFQLPERKDVTVTVVSLSPALSEGVAAMNINLQAVRGDLKLDINGIATLLPQPLQPARLEVKMRREETQIFGRRMSADLPEITLRKAEPMRFKLVIERLAPRASWGPFSGDIKGFVAEFAQLKLNEELSRQLPLIEVPIDNIIKIDQPIQQREFPLKEGATLPG